MSYLGGIKGDGPIKQYEIRKKRKSKIFSKARFWQKIKRASSCLGDRKLPTFENLISKKILMLFERLNGPAPLPPNKIEFSYMYVIGSFHNNFKLIECSASPSFPPPKELFPALIVDIATHC